MTKLAQSIFDHITESIKLFNELCEQQEQRQTFDLTDDWLEIRLSLSKAEEAFQETHHQLLKPLPLFEYLEKQKQS